MQKLKTMRILFRIGFTALLLLALTASCGHKKEEQEMINAIANKVWFTTLEERWNTNYNDEDIPESYRKWTFEMTPGSENWLWYFYSDKTGYEIHTQNYDTVLYKLEYSYTYKNNCFYVKYETTDGSTEEYRATIEQINNKHFVWVDEYRPHQFERVTNVNVTGSKRDAFKINPKNVKRKPVGPMIPTD